jgi:hypothetical protein
MQRKVLHLIEVSALMKVCRIIPCFQVLILRQFVSPTWIMLPLIQNRTMGLRDHMTPILAILMGCGNCGFDKVVTAFC